MDNLAVVHFCARECELQMSGEMSVSWMFNAWDYARSQSDRFPVVDDVVALGRHVEPRKNDQGFRKVGVRVGWDVKPNWREVPRQIVNLMEAVKDLTPAEFCREFLEIHPFVDGNGRTSAILFNWLSDTLDDPDWHGNWWSDPRRTPGSGAPRE